MKKLNRKGFTLIELLAVIVILALIIAIAIPNVLNAMDNSRKSSIHSKARSVVSWYSEAVLADSLVMSDSERIIPQAIVNQVTSSWKCFGDSTFTDSGKNLATLAELNSSDFVLTGTPPTGTTATSGTCSAIREGAGGEIEVILVANASGRFHIGSSTVTYAYSGDDTGTTA